MMPRSDKVTKEFLGGTESGSETEKHFSLDSGALSQDLDSDELKLITNKIINSKKQSKVAMMPPAEEQVNALAQVNVDQQEITVPTNQVANQAEGVIADQVAAISFPFTALAKVRKIFRPLNTMHNYLYKK